jgi:hypothetical protein
VQVGAVHELVGNALVMKDEKDRTNDLRGEPFVGSEAGGAEAGQETGDAPQAAVMEGKDDA